MKKSFVKKIILVMLALLLLSIAISASPILTYFQSLGAELETTPEAPDSTASLTTTAVTTTESLTDREPSQTALLFAVVFSAGTIVVAVIVFIKKHDPNA